MPIVAAIPFILLIWVSVACYVLPDGKKTYGALSK